MYGQVWIDGVTDQPGATPTLRAQLGFGPDGSDPAGNADWTWVDAAFNADAGNNDEFKASMLPERSGTFDYAYRYTTTAGRDWVYADLDGSTNGYCPAQAGALTVNASSDTTAPAVPDRAAVVAASPAGIELAWDAVPATPVLRLRGAPRRAPAAFTSLARTTARYTDARSTEGATYFYVVAVDPSFNRSGPSARSTRPPSCAR